jgi:hypothetical protein
VARRAALCCLRRFSKVADWLAFRNAAIRNSFENSPEAISPLRPRAWQGSSETLVIENNQPLPGRSISLCHVM